MEYITVNVDRETNKRIEELRDSLRLSKVDIIRLAVDKMIADRTPSVIVTTPAPLQVS